MHETKRLSHEGAVDADGHILEPPDIWERYIDPKFRDRALRFIIDDNGLEALEIGGKPSVMSRKGFPSTLGAMGDPDLRSMQLDPERTYLHEAPFGSMDPDERCKLLDAGARTSRRSRTTRARSAIPSTIRCSPPRKTSMCRSQSIPPSSRSGRRARAWARGRT
jgi:hypothetical protein